MERKREEMVKVGCNCARSVCWCSEGRIVKKSWAWSHDKPYRILSEQPMTLKERREQQASQAEIEALQSAQAKLRGRHGQRALGNGFLTERERKSLENFIGRPVETAQDARRAMKEKGLRFAEKGEDCHEMFDSMRANEAPDLEKFDLWGDESKRKPFDLKDTYYRNLQKYGRPIPQ